MGISIDIDLDEFDNSDIVEHLINEIEGGYLHKAELASLRNALGIMVPPEEIKIITTQDRMKWEIIVRHFNDLSADELEDRLTMEIEDE